ncbi:PREDICTED: cell division cycle-associated 7-like protein [Ipomoea nil]|uniref:cell division cycle-associated 7-like protein n=1 Tax=Ipomoea nil TaxID=35883 RepID=UPI000901060D|nr:PREDICTED: cell division cycle-associated 7-like protein [Ipomoea nil]
MAKRKTREEEEEKESKNEAAEEYEQHRAQRIKENMDRMKKLGLLELSKKLKPEIPHPKGSDKHKPPSHKKPPSTDDPPRRSSRLKSMNPVNYSERREASKGGKVAKDVEICIAEGEKPELYTKEHERVLGDSKESWSLYEDGYDEDGQRIYDPDFGKSCHQCRQKTLGLHTECSKCKSFQGQFCGDCLYMRYGENVIEVNENPSWICPGCRDICNCSRCRRVKGWAPTGAIYKKVLILGYKSVAHYLIMTFMQREKEEAGDENHHPSSIKSSEPSDYDLADDAIVVSDESYDKNEVLEKEKQQLDDDEEEEEEDESEDANASANDSE